MHLTLKRTTFTSESTIGQLSIDGQFECYVLEDVVRKPSTTKVYGKTAIPAGTYPVTITHSNRFGRLMPLLGGVPGFAGIRIHSGNTAADTEGCLLVGTTQARDFVGNSRTAYARLYMKIKAAIDRGNQVTISIS
ncbi:DUF5675 family protein [Hymenobacter metallicola]|uniref:DUF5675 domain-containing protein n=1 Tax=Hymenobacter metallicola TaxID=2563114 RepID=A0A4Z0Q0Q7_9BACT|nr:DUF5675 family protein [Hymenobacter metallicola]TGE23547.1 hypothetical protein E5K02_20390 [Hymenobacter metallicola]